MSVKDDCVSIFAAANLRNGSTRPSGWYLGGIMMFSMAVGFVPIELFLVEIWERHGFFSLLFVILPLFVGDLIVRHLPERYYQTRNFELSGRLYELLGIHFFKRLVPNGDYINRINRRSDPGYRVIRNKASLLEFESSTRLAERCHLVSLLMVLPSTIYAVALGWNQFALLLLLPNILVHLYPVLLQRYTRARIDRLLRPKRRVSGRDV